MLSSSTYETEGRPGIQGWQWGAAFGVLALLFAVGFAAGGELRAIMQSALESLPFMVLAVFAYLGIDRGWGKVLALLWLGVVVGGIGLLALGYSFTAVLDGSLPQPGGRLNFVAGGPTDLILIVALSIVAVLIGALGFLPAVRRAVSRVLPFDPQSFVHTIALVAIVSATLLSLIPLLVLGEPPLLTVIDRLTATGADLTGGRSASGQLRDRLYALAWLVPGAIVAVGYGIRRDFRAALARLGFVRPIWQQVVAGLGLAVVLVGVAQALGLGINWLWESMGWPRTNGETFGELIAFAISPVGAVVIGVTAGLGEELAIRGVLQPRLGILLSNLFFTSLHAYQYNWDGMLVVFIVGTALGLIRRRFNTSTSAITHGTYNFLLIIASVYRIPGLSE